MAQPTTLKFGAFIIRLNDQVPAGSFIVGQQYRIVTVGTTTFNTIGAATNTVGTTFTATGVGTGTGIARRLTAGNLLYTAPCGLTSRNMSITTELSDSVIPDCDDVDAPAFIGRDVRSKSFSLSGDGILAVEALPVWRRYAEATIAWSVQAELTTATGLGGGFYTFNGHMASFEVSGTLGEKIQISMEISADGAPIWTNL